jgi:hypothetical protein
MSLQIVQQTRAKYPTPLGASHPAFLLDLITALGPAYGLLRKDGGTHIVLPDGTRVSQDVISDRAGIQTDVLADGEGQAVPTWIGVDPGHYTPDPSRFYRPAVIVDPPQPEPEPPTSSDLEARVAALEAAYGELATAVNEAKRIALAAMDAASQAARKGDPVSVTGSLSLRDAVTSQKVTWTGQIL